MLPCWPFKGNAKSRLLDRSRCKICSSWFNWQIRREPDLLHIRLQNTSMYPHQISILTYRSKFLPQAKGWPSRNTENCEKEKEWIHEQTFLTVLYEGDFQIEILLCCFVKEGLRRYQQSCWSGTKHHLRYCWDSITSNEFPGKSAFLHQPQQIQENYTLMHLKELLQELLIFWAYVVVLKLGPYSVVGS